MTCPVLTVFWDTHQETVKMLQDLGFEVFQTATNGYILCKDYGWIKPPTLGGDRFKEGLTKELELEGLRLDKLSEIGTFSLHKKSSLSESITLYDCGTFKVEDRLFYQARIYSITATSYFYIMFHSGASLARAFKNKR